MAQIEVKDVSKIYATAEGATTVAVDSVSFEIETGEFVAIMGPSGSGKSTLLHILGFLDLPTKGRYKLNGKSVYDYSSAEAALVRNQEMGFIFQAFNLLPKTTVLENVKLPLQYSHVPEAEWNSRALAAIETVGMSHRIDHEPAALSGGEKQRAAIARALVMNPRIIFADEPTGNLDSKSGQAVMEAIQTLNDKGHTVILITHETSTAEHAKRILHVQDGAIVRDEKVKSRRRAASDFSK